MPFSLMLSAVSIWLNQLGDRTLADWLITVFYFLVAVGAIGTCAAVARKRQHVQPAAQPGPKRRVMWAWLGLAIGLLLLGLNKQLDLQILLTGLGRSAAHEGGWYESRRTWQAAFVATALGLAIVGGIGAAWLLRRERFPIKLALCGAAVQLFFVATRLSSFHHTDHLIGTWLVGASLQWRHALEAAGLLIMLVAMMFQVRPLRWLRQNRASHNVTGRPDVSRRTTRRPSHAFRLDSSGRGFLRD